MDGEKVGGRVRVSADAYQPTGVVGCTRRTPGRAGRYPGRARPSRCERRSVALPSGRAVGRWGGWVGGVGTGAVRGVVQVQVQVEVLG